MSTPLRIRLTDDMKTALREKDTLRLSVVRMMLAKLKEKDIEARPSGNLEGIGEADILRMIEGMVKQRQESAQMYRQGGALEAAAKEEAEVVILQGYLPKQLDEAAAEQAIRAVVAEVGAASIKDMGKVMAALRGQYAGQLDMAKAGEVVKRVLAG
jgi:uncharacterized protein YqeY